MAEIFWCKTCLNMSTRPRIEFNDNGSCNACEWSEEKKQLDWSKRIVELEKILSKYRNKSNFDCIVPVSGGKDGTYVADQLKNRFSINPLCVTIRPALELEVGKINLENFLAEGINHIHINPNLKAMSKLDKIGFTEYGQGYYGWMTAVHAVPPLLASLFNIKLIFYGEDGEVEYGGTNKYKYKPIYRIEHQKKVFLNDTYENVINLSGLSDQDLYWFKFPDKHADKIDITHYSYFENWDPYRNYLVAKEKYNLKDVASSNIGTFTNFAHNDQALSALHYYLMYIKYGIGRATSDASHEVRDGHITREEAVALVHRFDGEFPEKGFTTFLEYLDLTREEFWEITDRFRLDHIWEKKGNGWKLRKQVV